MAAPAWRRRTNVWRKGTRPARGPKLPISDRQRGAISCAANRRDPVAGSALPVFHRPLAARSRAEAEHELATIPTCIFSSACLQVSRRSWPILPLVWQQGNAERRTRGTKGMMYGLAALTVGISSILSFLSSSGGCLRPLSGIYKRIPLLFFLRTDCADPRRQRLMHRALRERRAGNVLSFLRVRPRATSGLSRSWC